MIEFDPALMRAFVAVNEAGGFTSAAQRLNLTQSAVSHQIRRLEEHVGRPLLRRTTRKVGLTEDGEEFLRHTRQILQLLDALALRFRSSALSGVVRFGVPESFMGPRLPRLLAQFAHAFPAVRLDVHVGTYLDLRTMIDANDLDLAVAVSVPGNEIADGTVLRAAKLVWVAAESFVLRPGASLPLAFSPSPCMHRQVGVRALEGTKVDWHIAFTSSSEQGLRAAVLAGLAVAVQIRSDMEPGMRIVDGRFGLPSLPHADFTLIWSVGGQTPAACAFGRMIQDLPKADGATSIS